MATTLNEESVEKKLRTVNNTQDSIQTLSLWIIHHKTNHAKIVELWMKVLRMTAQPSHRLTLFYLCNDVVQNCKKKKAFVYNSAFKEYLREAASLVRDQAVKGKVERIFNIWGERGVYDAVFIKSLHSILNGQQVKSYKVNENLKEEKKIAAASQVNAPKVTFEMKEAVIEPHTERDPEESARILADFKPHEMMEQITAFMRQQAEIQLKVSQLSHLKLDASSLEAVKHLKDRAHGNDFSNHFEDSCSKLEDLVKRQTGHLADQRALLEVLSLSETFYEEQYREAKIVANAYKNFGARINNMKKRLDELKKTFPQPDSPIPSPDINAPSPPCSPPHMNKSIYGYNPAAPMNYGQGLQPKSWMPNEVGPLGGVSLINPVIQDSDSFPDSPTEEAPSPEDSPMDLSLDESENASGSLESRLASFFDRGQSEHTKPSVYTPQLPRPTGTSGRSKVGDDEGSTTPLDDEAPTTPVQDEHLASPPKRSSPPKKENPIDFLSRLISQTQKTPVKTGTQVFLDSLTMLSMVNKKPEPDSQQQQQPATAQSWMDWKSKPNETSSSPIQPPSPTSYPPTSNLPSSPKQFPPILTMVPPPPIPLPVPPPVPLSLGLNIPPPFALTPALPPNFSNPPPGFQQTSPGQKENWPDLQPNQIVDHANSNRATHSSVLKELLPAGGMAAKLEQHLNESGMEVVSDDEDTNMLGSNVETSAAAKTEFAQKLKQKTSHAALKSHVFVPNPVRPNLMTLTVSDDLDEEDMIDSNSVMEEPRTWSEKADKSGHRSRSRSRSQEKDSSYRPKNKKEKWGHGENEESRLSENENRGASRIGSVKKIETHTNRNSRESNNGEKPDEKQNKHNDYWRYDNRKYDGTEGRGGYNNRGDFQLFHDNRASTNDQAYKEAFFQQYSQVRLNTYNTGPPPMDPRRPGYGKY